MNNLKSIFNIFLQDLSSYHKSLIDPYTAQRPADLSFGPDFIQQRTYYPITQKLPVEPPEQIKDFFQQNGWTIPDWLGRNVINRQTGKTGRLMNVMTELLKDNPEKLSEYRNEYLHGAARQNTRKNNQQLYICITHNPYDVGGMSTNKVHGTSCMYLPDPPDKKDWIPPQNMKSEWDPKGGAHYKTALLQVKYGGMCAYLIQESQKQNVQSGKSSTFDNALARIAIKRFINKNDPSDFIFIPQNTIYFLQAYADAVGFMKKTCEIIKQSNLKTWKQSQQYIMMKSDTQKQDMWTDNQVYNYRISDKETITPDSLLKLNKDDFIKTLAYSHLQVFHWFIQDNYNEPHVKAISVLNRNFQHNLKQPYQLIKKYILLHPQTVSDSKMLQFLDSYFQYLYKTMQTKKLFIQLKDLCNIPLFRENNSEKFKDMVKSACINLLQRPKDFNKVKEFVINLRKQNILTDAEIYGDDRHSSYYGINAWIENENDKIK